MRLEKNISRNSLKVIVGAAVLVLILIYIFLFDFSKRVEYQMSSMVIEHLADINGLSVKSIKQETDWVLEEVRFAANYISNTPEITEEGKNLIYNELKKKCGFANIRLVSADGKL